MTVRSFCERNSCASASNVKHIQVGYCRGFFVGHVASIERESIAGILTGPTDWTLSMVKEI